MRNLYNIMEANVVSIFINSMLVKPSTDIHHMHSSYINDIQADYVARGLIQCDIQIDAHL